MNRKVSLVMVFFFLVLFVKSFPGCFSAANQSVFANGFGSTLILLVTGDVYPTEYFHVNLNIGNNPPKGFDMDIDSGSDLTWVQCDFNCQGCTLPRDALYKPNNNFVSCSDPMCIAVHFPKKPSCLNPNPCEFDVEYADGGAVHGVLVKDNFHVSLMNGSQYTPVLTFGCGYNIKQSPQLHKTTIGIMGLDKSKVGLSSQLRAASLTENIFGHCYSSQGGGFFFIGADLTTPTIAWTPMLQSPSDNYYSVGPVEILFGGRPTGIRGLNFIIDSGSTYTYLSSKVYQAILNLIKKDAKEKQLTELKEKAFPVCWSGKRPFTSIRDIQTYFSTITLSFPRTGRASQLQLPIPPEAYLIISKSGNVCLGILNGGEAEVRGSTAIGDISMLNKMVIYDNVKQQIGWAAMDCNKRPGF